MKQQPLKIALCKKLESDLGPRWWFTHCWQPESETHIYQCTVLNTAKQEALVVKVATWWHTFDLFTYYFQLYLTLVFLFFLFFSPGKQKKKKQQSPRKRASEVQSERRNPSRKARPPEHFGLEQEPVVAAAKPRKSVEFDLKKLMEVNNKQTNKQTLHVLRVPVALCYNHYPRMMSKLGFELLI